MKARHNLLAILPWFFNGLRYFWSPMLGFPLIVGLLKARSRRMWMSMAAWGMFVIGLLLQVAVAPHHFAPGSVLLLVPVMYCVGWLRAADARFGPVAVLAFVALIFTSVFQPDRYHDWREAPLRKPTIAKLGAEGASTSYSCATRPSIRSWQATWCTTPPISTPRRSCGRAT